MFEKFFGKGEEEKKYTGNMEVDSETGEVITPEEAKRRRDEKLEKGPEQK